MTDPGAESFPEPPEDGIPDAASVARNNLTRARLGGAVAYSIGYHDVEFPADDGSPKPIVGPEAVPDVIPVHIGRQLPKSGARSRRGRSGAGDNGRQTWKPHKNW